MRQIVALASIVTLVAIVLPGCIWVPVDRGGQGYYGGPTGVSTGVTGMAEAIGAEGTTADRVTRGSRETSGSLRYR